MRIATIFLITNSKALSINHQKMTNLWGVNKYIETRISHRSRRCTRDAQRVVTSLITYDRADVKIR